MTPSDDGKGVVVTDVDPDSDAADRGLQAGDVITSVNSHEVRMRLTSPRRWRMPQGRPQGVLIQVTRDDNSRFVALPIARAEPKGPRASTARGLIRLSMILARKFCAWRDHVAK